MALSLKDEGLPIRGFCWYGFVDHVDWDSALTRNRGTVNTCGLVGLDRRPHRQGELYRELAMAARDGRYPRLERETPREPLKLMSKMTEGHDAAPQGPQSVVTSDRSL